MAKSAKIEFNGKSYSFPVITGSENEQAIDINELRSKTGLITYDPDIKILVIVLVKLLTLTEKMVF